MFVTIVLPDVLIVVAYNVDGLYFYFVPLAEIS